MLDGLVALPRTSQTGALRWLSLFLALFFTLPPQSALQVQAVAPDSPAVPAATVITVNTSSDLDSGSLTKTCTYTAGIYVAASDGCTLRRALLEAAARPQSDRPIAINFTLAANDPNKDKTVSGTWTLPIIATLPPLKTDTILNKNGQVTIDGDTQPGGRTTGPKIILDTNDNSLQVESTNNVIRNLAFKGGGAIFLKEDNNTVEQIWMGLSDDGQSIVFRTPANPLRMAGGGIFISSNNNTVQNNVISGAFARAIDIDGGDNNLITRNAIGTRADGTVPTVATAAQCLRSLSLDPQNWYGGWGIALSGSNNQIVQNRIAGLHIVQSQNDTPPMAIEIFGADHEVRGNVIGVDSANKRVGVCGQGIKVSGSGTKIRNNIIVRSRTGFDEGEPTAILASDTSPLFGQITVRGNLIESGPGKIYEFGPGIPALLRTFNPARLTNMSGTTITGGSGDSSPCPGCLIDFYRDDEDEIAEALDHLGSVVADSNGDFTLMLTQTLPSGVGIRTSSTTQAAGIIGNYGAGTTTKFSKLYMPMASVTITGPITGTIGVSYAFTITVNPAGATIPVDYAVGATDALTQTLTSTSRAIVATYTWPAAGLKTLAVTVKNELGTVNATHQITLTGSPADVTMLYLPLIQK